MMAPNPQQRPDVYELLAYRKLKDIQFKRRPKWWQFRKLVSLLIYVH